MLNDLDYSIGVDIGGTNIKFGLVDKQGKIIKKQIYPFNKEVASNEVIIDLGKRINEFLSVNKIDKDSVKEIGIGCPGSIDSTLGICDYSNNIKFKDVHLVDIIQRITGLKAKASNDANVACLGEAKFGTYRNYQNIVFLTLGTGVGGGLVLNGLLYEGKNGKGAELGHSLLKINGRKCTCGRRGCLEAYASATALIKDTKRSMKKHPDSLLWKMVSNDITKVEAKTVFDACQKKDPTATELIDHYIYYLGEGIINFINIFKPDVILLSGGISKQGTLLTKPLNEYIQRQHYGFGGGPQVEIKISTLGSDAGIIGASALFNS